jgi:ABC-2 type transport system ATP-binding protein
VIEVRDLAKRYARRLALDGVTFSVAPGEVAGFLGPNGAGKTTTLRILAGFLAPSGGAARVAGYEVTGASREVRRRVGYLPEDVPLYRDLTVDAFLRYMAGLKEVPPARLGAEVDRVVERAGLGPVRRLLISKCSRGYRQRVGLAMALVGDPPVLLLDEPTTGLDPNQVIEVRELIRGLGERKTVLLSSHILSEVAQICSRLLIIHEGRLAAEGTPEDLARRFGGGGRIRIRLRPALSAEALAGMSGVARVNALQPPGAYRLHVEDLEGTAAAVVRALVGRGVDVLELVPEGADLEAVFRSAVGFDTGEAGRA